MPSGLDRVLQQLRLAAAPGTGGLSDSLLLKRFADEGDEAAFEVLVWRHGTMVLTLCRRILRHEQDAEDAFQATFLVLARKARSVRNRQAIGGWLYRVAYRVAREARTAAERRTRRERFLEAATAAPPAPDQDDLGQTLADELSRLPEKYRTPMVLCYLQGKTYQEAARLLGCPKGTLSIRLHRARQRLQARLAGRSLAPTGLIVTTMLAHDSAKAALPATLAKTAVKAGCALAGGFPATGFLSVNALNLSKGVIRAMTFTQLKLAALVLLVVGLTGAGTGVLAFRGAAPEPPTAHHAAPDAPSTIDSEELVRAPSPFAGVLILIGTDMKTGEEVAPRQVVSLKADGETMKYRRLRPGDAVAEGQLLARLDDRLARNDVAICERKVAAAQADLRAADATRDEALVRSTRQELLLKTKSTSNEEAKAAQFIYQRFKQDATARQEAVKIAKLELKRAETLLAFYQIRSPVPGVIRKITHHQGEAVRQYETLFFIGPADR